jgi:Tfp pilus assembly protein PilF
MPPTSIDQALQAAVEHHKAGRLQQAEVIYRQILAAQPNHPHALHFLGMIALAFGRFDLATDLIGRAIANGAGGPDVENNHGNALHGCGRWQDAADAFGRAIALKADFAQAWHNLGNALMAAGKTDEGVEAYYQAIKFQPDLPESHNNLANALQQRGQLHQSIAHYRATIAARPDWPMPHHNLAQALLLAGDLVEGFREYEWRKRMEGLSQFYPKFSKPAWDGADLNGARILLYAEQGMGDTIQFIRYAPLIADRGGQVILQCQPELVRLMETVPNVSRVVSKIPAEDDFDAQCALLSLPTLFGTSLQSVPASIPYLRADAELASRWRQRLPSDVVKVGLAWAGRADYVDDRNRSLSLELLAPLLEMKNVTFISLQKRASSPASSFPLLDWSSEFTDFADTAALIDQLDLVISVDTAVAHLAGAMGRPVWTLIPFAPDWRWMLKRDDSPWYPTMRLFRQPKLGDWETPIRQIVHALGSFK